MIVIKKSCREYYSISSNLLKHISELSEEPFRLIVNHYVQLFFQIISKLLKLSPSSVKVTNIYLTTTDLYQIIRNIVLNHIFFSNKLLCSIQHGFQRVFSKELAFIELVVRVSE